MNSPSPILRQRLSNEQRTNKPYVHPGPQDCEPYVTNTFRGTSAGSSSPDTHTPPIEMTGKRTLSASRRLNGKARRGPSRFLISYLNRRIRRSGSTQQSRRSPCSAVCSASCGHPSFVAFWRCPPTSGANCHETQCLFIHFPFFAWERWSWSQVSVHFVAHHGSQVVSTNLSISNLPSSRPFFSCSLLKQSFSRRQVRATYDNVKLP